MYELKKASTLRTMEKKQKKVDEINKVLEEDITPTLEKLRRERAEYMQWAASNAECERLSRLCIAFEFTRAETILNKSEDEVHRMEETMQSLQSQALELEASAKACEQRISEFVQRKEQEMEGSFRELEKQATELSKDLVKHNSVHAHKNELLQAEATSAAKLERHLGKVDTSISAKKKEVEKAQVKTQEAETRVGQLQEDLENTQRKYQALSAGMVASDDDDGVDTSLATRLEEARRTLISAQTESTQAQMKIKHLEAEKNEKGRSSKTAEAEYKKLRADHDRAVAAIAALTERQGRLHHDPNQEVELLKQKSEEEAIIAGLQEKVDEMTAQLSGLEFVYRDPEPNFDHSRVKGLVANLLTVRDVKATTALEVTAGRKVFNVVVDTEDTGKKLLQKGQLRRRVTIIPLNKIHDRTLSNKVVRTAKQVVGKENVSLALELVGFDEEVQAAMKYVFGTTLICGDMESAKTVTFNRDIMALSVTLDGDKFDPSGTLTGGFQPQAGSILLRLQALNQARSDLADHQSALNEILAKLQSAREVGLQYLEFKRQIELKQHEVDLCSSRLAQSAHGRLLEEMHVLESALDTERARMEQAGKTEADTLRLCSKLEANIKELHNHREVEMTRLEGLTTKCKEAVARATKEMKSKHQDVERLTMELEEMNREAKGMKEQLETSRKTVEKMAGEVAIVAEELEKRKHEYERAKAELDEQRRSLSVCDSEITAAEKEKAKLGKQITNTGLEHKKIDHKLVRLLKDQKEAALQVERMMDKYSWIASEKQYFGKPHTDYNFREHDVAHARQRLDTLQEEQAAMGKRINKKVMGMFEKAEQEYEDLIRKKQIIENDKKKIEEVIEELDEKKNEALRQTYSKVNRDFGSIFSTLLPGAQGRLDPPEGMSVLEGLEMKVAFGNVWKDTLSELSGGQKSLLSLSLILSLLLFKPAPVYILDEIDAALDPSHTQNIGQMLKNHFQHSQFVVVSLKEGMFNNANVLFRTKFVDGVSTVTRTARRDVQSHQ
eukprot:TRINITY_DN7596_c0_g1_i1.p1 TRINITY_DN7596_c0_g1~~TRINITY_DN7596_c0_g1_i1.p1  ORF type:complete len:1189 (+),score=336.54 TRINITY_DN7596_c0_g1_i1:537-3569(+)